MLRRLDLAAASLAVLLAANKLGMAIAASNAIIAATKRTSTSVKPDEAFFFIFFISSGLRQTSWLTPV